MWGTKALVPGFVAAADSWQALPPGATAAARSHSPISQSFPPLLQAPQWFKKGTIR